MYILCINDHRAGNLDTLEGGGEMSPPIGGNMNTPEGGENTSPQLGRAIESGYSSPVHTYSKLH